MLGSKNIKSLLNYEQAFVDNGFGSYTLIVETI